jgi:pyridoxal phosphate enzyme (YggS family)
MRLLSTIDVEGGKHDRVINCLLQVHIAEEESKSGFTEEELDEVLHGSELSNLKHVNVKGLMGMATYTHDKDKVSGEFRNLKEIFDKYENLEILSMGMSGDYQIAIEEGSNMVRVGSLIFGERN